jgi:hypothetical protein
VLPAETLEGGEAYSDPHGGAEEAGEESELSETE